MRETILTGWNWMRWLRFAIGAYALVQSVIEKEPLLALAGIFLLGMSIFNIGCCAGGVCASPPRNIKSGKDEIVLYEEIKSDKQ